MSKSYIVDAFLSGMAWMLVIYLFFNIKGRISELNEIMDASTLAAAFSNFVKPASLLSTPFCAFFTFLLWRFYGLMDASLTWGAGGLGLLVGLFLVGMPLIWLEILLILVRHSSFVDLSQKLKAYKKQAGALND